MTMEHDAEAYAREAWYAGIEAGEDATPEIQYMRQELERVQWDLQWRMAELRLDLHERMRELKRDLTIRLGVWVIGIASLSTAVINVIVRWPG